LIDKIYIPTIRRADNQVTYDNLPSELQKKVTMVVDKDERPQYNYDCEYLELSDWIPGCDCQIGETRKLIYNHAGKIRYAMMDDDLIIRRRNAKYWTGKSNMEMSRRDATPDEILLAFDTLDKWLDEPDIGVVGMTDLSSSHPPPNKEYLDTVFFNSVYVIDGKMLQSLVDESFVTAYWKDESTMPLPKAEDLLFVYECLHRGMNTRKSIEWCFANKSNMKSRSTASISGTGHDLSDRHYDSLKYIQSKFPTGIKFGEKNGIPNNRKYCKNVYRPMNFNEFFREV
jgi:hypothetical protein